MPSLSDKNKGVLAASARLKITTYPPTIWGSANFAKGWFNDAYLEAASPPSVDSVRREIIFSVCFLESYLFEWVRTIDISAVDEYFPFDRDNRRYRRNLKDKWKKIPHELYADGRIQSDPELDLSKFGELIKYRNGLVHAAASRPFNSGIPEEQKPIPNIEILNTMNPGWALGVSVALVKQLHDSTGTDCPDYIQELGERGT